MSAPLSLPSPWSPHPVQTQPATNEPPARVIFTRQLWQRTMPDGISSEPAVLNKSQAQDSFRSDHSGSARSRRTSSSVSTRSTRRSPSPARSSKTPLTPEESPPFRITRKRNADKVDIEDKGLNSPESVPPCICQPPPKIPRPRNAFILYRQHHQSQVVAQHPGLANPEISKIIGENWQNQSAEVKNRWKALAEEEKIRHQQQYPTYRYQPKRNGRRNSQSDSSTGEKGKCTKCGGRPLLTPSTPFSNINSQAASPASTNPSTPLHVITPVSRTLPILKDLSLQSPAHRRMGKQVSPSRMSPGHQGHHDERDEMGPLSPDMKRRRFNGDRPLPVAHTLPPRYGSAAQAGPVGPGTPFPFGQAPASSSHPYPPAVAHARRESLPGLRGMVSPPGPMAPPPRPGPGYQQHRLSQGHAMPHDRSLTLPPLQTGSVSGPSGAAAMTGTGKTAEEQIMSMSFQYKVKVLGQVAPPAPLKDGSRGPLIAIEGDSAAPVAALGKWLNDELKKSDDLAVHLFDGPTMTARINSKPMIQYHLLATEWLTKSDEILATISSMPIATTPRDSNMGGTSPSKEPASSTRVIDENYDDSGDDQSTKSTTDQPAPAKPTSSGEMDVDKTPTTATFASSSSTSSTPPRGKPVALISNFSLHASNIFACRIPIGPHDPYSPSDHWQWTATQWRGIVGPDLTIFVRDAAVGESGKPTVEMSAEGNLFVVKRVKAEGEKGWELDPSALRRLGFEVSEWVRAFGVRKRGSA